ncbi:hypothetical protein SB659_10385 [Arthrobacter sp. SIMBA_036]|uniref:DUF7302 family protein n=1 Tax=Arthrobacter sp. SIMBA_036 TaxID=3085778 RepID=UPI00397CA87D
MPRLINSVTGVIVNVDEETAQSLGREWSVKVKAPKGDKPAPENPGAGDQTPPAGNAALADWQAYALAKGKTEEEIKDLKREDIKALFESE